MEENSDKPENNGAEGNEAENNESVANGAVFKDDLVKKISQLEDALDQAKKDTLYLRAEFDTYKRNSIKERSELVKYGAERFITSLLEVTDNLDRALMHTPTKEQFETYIKGVQMTAQELKSLLTRFNVREIECEGKDFDPLMHEALGSEVSDESEPGKILRVFKKPYKLYDKLIRPGQVIIAKKGE